MMILQGKFLGATTLEARGDYPPSHLVTLYDEAENDTLNLIASKEAYDLLEGRDQFSDVHLRLRWRRVDLARFGGTGRGKAYRLQVVAVVEPTKVAR